MGRRDAIRKQRYQCVWWDGGLGMVGNCLMESIKTVSRVLELAL